MYVSFNIKLILKNDLGFYNLLKSSRNKKDLNDVTAAPFLVSFSQLPAAKITQNGAAVIKGLLIS